LAETVLGRRLAPFDRSIDVHISSLRKKLDAPAGGQDRIKAIRGVGYFYAPIDLGKKARKSSSRPGREEG
jgi:two-component system response regulator CpxR